TNSLSHRGEGIQFCLRATGFSFSLLSGACRSQNEARDGTPSGSRFCSHSIRALGGHFSNKSSYMARTTLMQEPYGNGCLRHGAGQKLGRQPPLRGRSAHAQLPKTVAGAADPTLWSGGRVHLPWMAQT